MVKSATHATGKSAVLAAICSTVKDQLLFHHVPPPVKATRQTDPGRDLSVLPGRDSYPEDDWPSDDIASDRTHLPYNLPSTSSGFFAAKRSDTSDVIQQVEHSFDSLSVPVQQAFPESQQPVASVLPAAVFQLTGLG